jgi:hypothetical protein
LEPKNKEDKEAVIIYLSTQRTFVISFGVGWVFGFKMDCRNFMGATIVV